MFQHLKQLSKHSIVYGLGTFITNLISFVLIPLYSRYLSQADYGMLTTLGILSTVLGIIMVLGAAGSFTRLYYDYGNEVERKRCAGAVWLLILLFSFAVALLLDLFGSRISIFRNIPFSPYVRMTIWTAFFSVASALPLTLMMVKRQAVRYAATSIVMFSANIIAIIFFVTYLKTGVLGVVIAKLYVSIAFFILFTLMMAFYMRLDLGAARKIIPEALNLGLPLVPSLIAIWTLAMIDRFFLERMLGLAVVGIYSIGYSFGLIMEFIVSSMSLAWVPFFFANAKSPEFRQAFSRLSTYFIAVAVFSALCLNLFSSEIILLMATSKFYEARLVMPVIVASALLHGLYYLPVNCIHYRKKTWKIALITLASAVTNCLLNWLLIPRYGMMGAAYATLLSYLLLLILAYIEGNRLYRIDYEYGRVLKLLACGGALYAVSLIALKPQISLSNIAAKLVITAIFPLLLLASGFFYKDEKEKVRIVLKKVAFLTFILLFFCLFLTACSREKEESKDVEEAFISKELFVEALYPSIRSSDLANNSALVYMELNPDLIAVVKLDLGSRNRFLLERDLLAYNLSEEEAFAIAMNNFDSRAPNLQLYADESGGAFMLPFWNQSYGFGSYALTAHLLSNGSQSLITQV